MKRAILFICSVLFLSGCTDLFHKEEMPLELKNISPDSDLCAVILHWQNPDNNYLEKIEIEYSEIANPESILGKQTVGKSKLKPNAKISARIPNLVNGKQYVFKITTRDMMGNTNSEAPVVYFAGNGTLMGTPKPNQESPVEHTIIYNSSYVYEYIIVPRGTYALVSMCDDSSWDKLLETEEDYFGAFPKKRKVRLNPYSLSDNANFIDILKENDLGLETGVKEMGWSFPRTYETACYLCNCLSKKTGYVPYYKIEEPKIMIHTDSGINDNISSAKISKNTEEGAEYGWRLPTLAEWEYAYRGGNPNNSSWGEPVYSYYWSESQFELENNFGLHFDSDSCNDFLSSFKYDKIKEIYEYEKIFEQDGFIIPSVTFGDYIFCAGKDNSLWTESDFIHKPDENFRLKVRFCRTLEP